MDWRMNVTLLIPWSDLMVKGATLIYKINYFVNVFSVALILVMNSY